jgi:hypothetical protein
MTHADLPIGTAIRVYVSHSALDRGIADTNLTRTIPASEISRTLHGVCDCESASADLLVRCTRPFYDSHHKMWYRLSPRSSHLAAELDRP